MIEKSHRWHKTAIAAAAIALLSLSATGALALSLGPVNVQSLLGEPLRAEIEVPNISPEEAASLKTNVASAAAFVAAGFEYNAAMSGLKTLLVRRSDGSYVISISSDRVINDPFLELILEANCTSGRIVRDYSMLFDPPSTKQSAPSPLMSSASAMPIPGSSLSSTGFKGAVVSDAPGYKLANSLNGPAQVKVKPGDSARKIAVSAKGSDVSIDQMLVALLRMNPDAFAMGNLAGLRTGSVVDLPSSDQAKSISSTEASQIVAAQSREFNDFRRIFSISAPKVDVESTDRKSTGKVDFKVTDNNSDGTSSDKLTLSQSGLSPKVAALNPGKDRLKSDSEARAIEMAKNIADLTKLRKEAEGDVVAKKTAEKSSEPKVALSTPSVEVIQATTPSPAASEPISNIPALVASAPIKKSPKPVLVLPTVAEPRLVDQIMDTPGVLIAGGLLLGLAAFGLYRGKKSKKLVSLADGSAPGGMIASDSLFLASGGQQVDTTFGEVDGRISRFKNNSQINPVDDVDPVAEADVYLAYGREVQAEEILKGAMAIDPTRIVVHTRLLDIYVKRRDAEKFLVCAKSASVLVGKYSVEWAQICAQGLSIDPKNHFYIVSSTSASNDVSVEKNERKSAFKGASMAAPSFQAPAYVSAPASSQALQPVSEEEMDLDFSYEELPVIGFHSEEKSKHKIDAAESKTEKPVDPTDSGDLDFDLSAPDKPGLELKSMEMSFDVDSLDLNLSPKKDKVALTEEISKPISTHLNEVPPSKAISPFISNDFMLEFDLGSLDLDI